MYKIYGFLDYDVEEVSCIVIIGFMLLQSREMFLSNILILSELMNSFHLQLNGLEKSFYSFYVCTAVRKFFFFLDPMRTGRIKIQDILACSFLDDLLEVFLVDTI